MCEEKTLSIEMAKTTDADDRVWEASSTQSWADRRWQTKPSGLQSATDELAIVTINDWNVVFENTKPAKSSPNLNPTISQNLLP